MSTPVIDKVTENRLRRVASRQGFTLHKSRARDPRHRLFGRYQLRADPVTMALHSISPDKWLTADEIAEQLQERIY